MSARRPTADLIREECLALADMLVEKNVAYGDSALDPLRVLSRANPVEQIRVRLDDKLSRLARGAAAGEDVVQDLLGYLILLRVAEQGASGTNQVPIPEPTAAPIVGVGERKRCSHCDSVSASLSAGNSGRKWKTMI